MVSRTVSTYMVGRQHIAVVITEVTGVYSHHQWAALQSSSPSCLWHTLGIVATTPALHSELICWEIFSGNVYVSLLLELPWPGCDCVYVHFFSICANLGNLMFFGLCQLNSHLGWWPFYLSCGHLSCCQDWPFFSQQELPNRMGLVEDFLNSSQYL